MTRHLTRRFLWSPAVLHSPKRMVLTRDQHQPNNDRNSPPPRTAQPFTDYSPHRPDIAPACTSKYRAAVEPSIIYACHVRNCGLRHLPWP
ncbi:hypothetical protein BDV96DRAFT_351584 [Lophiotrema nucula]|uniref:Uncharacterized protein n=1 Tax=Lophiotrema nucula TaxID=690887 RepID=A0A6A5ZLJ6_9PLEO|nr:hypothetical protein BDV96DRAFT_351584 [Lophiotrema nucula]